MISGRCYLCLEKSKYQDALLCTSCFCHLQDYRWVSCSRCGHLNCAGCHELSDFNKVTSSYNYKETLANILILSKEKNNLNAQKVFYELFFVPIKNALVEEIKKENYQFIVVSPLRKERILNSRWHPNLFYDDVLKNIYENELSNLNKPQVLFPYYSHKKKKQALVPSNMREEKQNSNSELIYDNLPKDNLSENSKVLLLDDVLTSGETALNSKRMSEKSFPNSIWDLFTILRAAKTNS